jgi:hypothetical protein
MNWKICKDLGGIALAVGVCVGAYWLNGRAWELGFHHPEHGMMQCQGWAFFILVPAWLSVILLIHSPPRKEKATGPSVWEVIVFTIAIFSMVFSCMGGFTLWPAVAIVVVTIVVAAVLTQPKQAGGATWWVIGRSAITAVLFMTTWYLAASMLRQGLHGFGERLEEKVDDDRLIAWAEEVIAECKQGKDVHTGYNPIFAEKIPEFIHDLMGGHPERTRVMVVLMQNDTYVTVATSMNQSLQITVRPSRAPREPGVGLPAWLVRDAHGFEWRPGVYVDLAGNFR